MFRFLSFGTSSPGPFKFNDKGVLVLAKKLGRCNGLPCSPPSWLRTQARAMHESWLVEITVMQHNLRSLSWTSAVLPLIVSLHIDKTAIIRSGQSAGRPSSSRRPTRTVRFFLRDVAHRDITHITT